MKRRQVGSSNEYIELNVQGRIYATNRQALTNSPAGLLSRLFGADRVLDGMTVTDDEGRIFFNRDADAFATVLSYLVTGVARVPEGVARHRARRELEYFFDSPPLAYTDAMCDAFDSPDIVALIAMLRDVIDETITMLRRRDSFMTPIICDLPIGRVVTTVQTANNAINELVVECRIAKKQKQSLIADIVRLYLMKLMYARRDDATTTLEDTLSAALGATCVRVHKFAVLEDVPAFPILSLYFDATSSLCAERLADITCK